MSAGVIPVADLAVRIMTAGVEPTTRAMAQVEKQGQNVGKAMGKTSETVQSLIYSFNGLAASALGINPSFGTLFANLAPFFLSGTVTAGVLVGLTVMGRAYRALGGDARRGAEEAAQAALRLKTTLDEMQNAGDVDGLKARARRLYEGSAAHGFRDGIVAFRKAVDDRAAELAEFEAQGSQGYYFLDRKRRELAALATTLAKMEAQFNNLQVRILGDGPRSAPAGMLPVEVEGRSPNAKGAGAGRNTPGAMGRFGRLGTDMTADEIRRRMILADVEAAAQQQAVDRFSRSADVTDAFAQQVRESMLPDMKGAFDDALKAVSAEVPKLEGWPVFEQEIAAQMASSFGGALGDGIQRAVQSGSLVEGFKALTGSLLGGFGGAMRAFGEKALLASVLMEKIKASLASFLPGGAIVASIAMIGIGAALQGAAQASFGGRGGGGGSFGGALAGGSYGPGLGAGGIIDRGVIAGALGPSIGAGAFGGVPTNAAARAMGDVYNVTVIGEDDPRAQRAIVSLINKGVRERNLKLEGR